MCPSMYLGTQPLSPQEILKLKYLSDTLNVMKHDIVSISPIDQSSPRCHCDNSCDWQNQITGRMIDVTCMKGKSSSSIRSEFRVAPQRFRILGSQLSAFQPSTSFSQTILLELETSKLYYQAVFLPSTLSSFPPKTIHIPRGTISILGPLQRNHIKPQINRWEIPFFLFRHPSFDYYSLWANHCPTHLSIHCLSIYTTWNRGWRAPSEGRHLISTTALHFASLLRLPLFRGGAVTVPIKTFNIAHTMQR